MENRILLRPSAKKSSTPILDGVENSSSDIQKCGFCLNLSAKQDFPPRYMDAYCGVENRVLLRPSTKKSSTLILDGVEDSSSDIQKCGFCLNLLAEHDFPPRYMASQWPRTKVH